MAPTGYGIGEIPDLHQLLHAAPVGFALIDQEHGLVMVNAVLAQIGGQPHDEQVGSRLDEVLGPEAGARVGTSVDSVFEAGSALLEQEVGGWVGGEWRDFLASYYPVADGPGDMPRLVGVFLVEITSRTRAEKRVQEERRRLEAVIRQLPVGVIVADASGRLMLGNDAVSRIWRHPFHEPQTVEGHAEYRGFHTDGRPLAPDEWPLARALRRDEVVEGEEIVFERGDGSRGVMRASAAPVRDAQGRTEAAVVVFEDVTRRRRAEERLSLLADVGELLRAPLDVEERLRRIAIFAVPRLGDWCGIDLLEDGTLRRIAVAHADPERRRWAEELARRYPPRLDEPGGLADALRTGEPALYGEIDDQLLRESARDEEHLRLLREVGLRSALVVPLAVRERTLGALTLAWSDSGNRYTEEDVELATLVAGRAALAVENARLYQAQHAAREAAEQTARDTDLVARVVEALETVIGLEDRARRLAEALVPELADYCAVDLPSASGHGTETFASVSSTGGRGRLLARLRRRLREAGAPDPVESVLRGGAPLLIPDARETLAGYAAVLAGRRPLERAIEAVKASSLVVLPLRTRGRTIAALSLMTAESGRRLDDRGVVLAAEIARRVALSLDNALLFEAEQRARRDAEAARARLAELQSVTAALAGALTPEHVARHVVRAALTVLGADAGAVFELSDDGETLHSLASSGYGNSMRLKYGTIPADMPGPAAEALASGRLVEARTPEEIASRWPSLAGAQRQSGDRCFLCAPLVDRDAARGVLHVVFRGDRTPAAVDRSFVEALAGLTAQALGRARRYADERAVSATLQRSLLPPSLPQPEGVALGVRYLPAAGLEAGGDWYDALTLPDGRVGIAVGDVVGRGVDAAAVMGQLRSALRAYAIDGSPPASVIGRLSRLAQEIAGARVATVVYAVVDPATGEIRYTCAGHPYPLLVDAGGARFLASGRGAPLAAGDHRLPEALEVVPRGATLLLYSDGLVERRGSSIDAGFARLASAAMPLWHRPLEEFLDEVTAQVLADGPSRDDVAALAIRLAPPEGLALSIPAEAKELGGLRRSMRVWLRGAGVSQETEQTVLLACGELAANAVEHAYLGRPPGHVELVLTLTDGGDLEATVRDRGHWRDPPAPGDRGRGLPLVARLTRDVRMTRGAEGTEVRLTISPSLSAPS